VRERSGGRSEGFGGGARRSSDSRGGESRGGERSDKPKRRTD
jgi:hypothetical protein